MMSGTALSGVTVVDFAQGIAGPYCACLLGELGAHVIKVEPPEGDWGRKIGPQYGDAGVIFRTFNRGKRSVVLDLKEPVARQAALRLVDTADVFIESNRPRVLQRYGLDYASLHARNARLVYVSVTGFGQTGSYANRAATDSLMQAYTGLSFAAEESGRPGRLRIGIIDVSAGIYANSAVLAALITRQRSRSGQYLDINLTHTSAALQAYKIAEDAASGGAPQQELFAGTGTYRTRDGWIAVSAIRDKHVIALLRIAGRSDLLSDAMFASTELRLDHQEDLRKLIATEMEKMPTQHWLRAMQEADVMGQEVLSYARFREDAHVRDRRIFMGMDDAACGPLPMVRMPGLDPDELAFEPYPPMGQNTREELAAAGVATADIEALLKAQSASDGARREAP